MPRKLIDDQDILIRGKHSSDTRRERPEREATSWRDKDRSKDRSAHSTPDARERQTPGVVNRFKAEQDRKGNLAAAEALFANPAKEGLEKKMMMSTGSTLEAAGKEYVEKYGYPFSFDLLARLAEHPSGTIMAGALERIEPLMANQSPQKRQNLMQALQLISLSAKDPIAKKAAASFISRSSEKNVSS